MEFFGYIAFVMALLNLSLPTKVNNLQRQVKKLKSNNKEKNPMSEIIKDLVGKSCLLTTEDSISYSKPLLVLQADEDWVKIEKTDKKTGKKTVEIIRIESIKKIQLADEN